MRNRFFASIGTLAAAMLLMSLAQASVRGQAAAKDKTTASATSSAAAKGAFVTSWGDPDLRKISGPLFEYACHEGNYGMAGILSGHRAQERTTAGARKEE